MPLTFRFFRKEPSPPARERLLIGGSGGHYAIEVRRHPAARRYTLRVREARRDVVLTMLPVMLSGLLTFATCAALGLPLNFTNIIALPLLFGIGVAFNIYFVLAWRAGETAMLQSSLMRAVVFSALVTATAFGALWLSSHPGTASMGRLLMISLGWELLVTLLFRPALLALPAARPCQESTR